MIRKKLVIALILAALCGLVWQISREDEQKADIAAVFSEINFMNTYSEVEIISEYGSVFLEEDEKKSLLLETAGELGIYEDMTYESVRDKEKITTVLKREGLRSSVEIEFITIEEPMGNNVIYLNQYIVVRIKIRNSFESAVYYKDKLVEYFESEDMHVSANVSVRGELAGDLNLSARDEITNRMFAELNSELVIENRDSEKYILYGYSKDIEDYIIYGQDRVNVTIMIDYDEASGITNVYLATPIIR